MKFPNMDMDVETQDFASLQQLDVATTILGRQILGDLSWEAGLNFLVQQRERFVAKNKVQYEKCKMQKSKLRYGI